jgi:hypothetical protein
MGRVSREYWEVIELILRITPYCAMGIAGRYFGNSISERIIPLFIRRGVVKKTPWIKELMRVRPDVSHHVWESKFGKDAIKEVTRRPRIRMKPQQGLVPVALPKEFRHLLTDDT